MPPQILFDLSGLDLEARPLFDKEAICQVNPQRYEMQQLDGIIWYDLERSLILGYKDVTENEFWVRGHIPGRPLMPGVVMIECAAQLLSFFVRKMLDVREFVGFGGIESAKFRAPVQPGCRLYLLGQLREKKSRRYTCATQGLVNGTIVFEATIMGVRM
ncbi:MAG: 3-hydroxyacyl-ACP dehydratase FabZ family protein [Sedimentisphaerales bacterium]|jgi:3-hydroxyacyl-[acyl-carrier-protein] dehydratase|nr:3-hydroxyacyl-ACP dehydratase FabZ family protein [Sedimentisphaerales bacterium]